MSQIQNHPAFVWLTLAVLFIIFEMLLPYFGFLLTAGACLVALVVAILTPSWEFQTCAFAVSVFVGLFVLRPRLLSRFKTKSALPSRTEALIGKSGRVTEAVVTADSLGRAVIEDQDWAIRSVEGPLPVSTAVTVVTADGIVLNVQKLTGDQ